MKLIYALLGIITSIGLSGCATFNSSEKVAAEREDMLILREDLTRLQGQVETLNMEYKRLLTEIDTVQGYAVSSKEQESAVQSRLDSLERRVQALDTARASDRQAIVDQISAKMAELLSAGSGRPAKTTSKTGSATPATKSSTPAKGTTAAGRDIGYEHVVKDGETLAAIAAAYKVKTSAIIEANALKDPDKLKKGQKLFIPQQ